MVFPFSQPFWRWPWPWTLDRPLPLGKMCEKNGVRFNPGEKKTMDYGGRNINMFKTKNHWLICHDKSIPYGTHEKSSKCRHIWSVHGHEITTSPCPQCPQVLFGSLAGTSFARAIGEFVSQSDGPAWIQGKKPGNGGQEL